MALRADEQAVFDLVESWDEFAELETCVQAVVDYRDAEWYESKQARIDAWDIDHRGIYELVISIWTATLVKEFCTYQSVVGMLQHKINHPDEKSRIILIADIIGLCVTNELLAMVSEQGEYHQLHSNFEVEIAIPQVDKHKPVLSRPQPVEANYDRSNSFGSMLLGHRMNHHEHDINLSHLRRMNAIKFCLCPVMVEEYEQTPKEWPETDEELAQWENFRDVAQAKAEEMIANNNRFFIPHKYDHRGRTYACQYYFNYQGRSYQKALVQFLNKEVVTEDII